MRYSGQAATAACVAVLLVVLTLVLVHFPARGGERKNRFWTQYGGAIPADEQVRRFDAAGIGVPDMPWAQAYWPPHYCGARD